MLMRRARLMQPLVESWFELLPHGQQGMARALHQAILACAPQLDFSVRSGQLVYALDGAHVMALAPHRLNTHLQVFHPAPEPMRPGAPRGASGPRHLVLRNGRPWDVGLVTSMVQTVLRSAAARDVQRVSAV